MIISHAVRMQSIGLCRRYPKYQIFSVCVHAICCVSIVGETAALLSSG